MIESGIDNSSLLRINPALDQYYPSGQTTFNFQITEALRQIVRELKRNRKDIRKFCTPLSIQALVTKTADFTGDWVADPVERMLWIVNVSSFTDDVSFTLEGTDDDGTTYEEIVTLSFTETGEQITVFTDVYKEYRVKFIGSESTEYKSDLIESSFYHAHLYLSLSLACKTALKNEGDRFDYFARMYEQEYLNEINNMFATYDEDSSGDIDGDEITKQTSTEFLR